MAYKNLAAMFKWGDELKKEWRRLMIDGNPLKLVDIKKLLDRNYTGVGERVLSADEITELDHKIYDVRTNYENAPAGTKYNHDRPINPTVDCAIWIMLGTLTRVGETTLAKWEDVNFDARHWFIPRENVKAVRGNEHKAQSIWLSDFVLYNMRRLHKLTGHTLYLFPNKDGTAPRGTKEITKYQSNHQTMFQETKGKKGKKQDNLLVLSKGRHGKWTSHDLRRTGATMLEGLRDEHGAQFKDHVIDKCQNHVKKKKGSRKHYLRYQYDAEMKDAWRALGAALEPLVKHAFERE